MQELDSDGDGLNHDVSLAVVKEDAAHDVTGHLSMRRITSTRGSETVTETGLRTNQRLVNIVSTNQR